MYLIDRYSFGVQTSRFILQALQAEGSQGVDVGLRELRRLLLFRMDCRHLAIQIKVRPLPNRQEGLVVQQFLITSKLTTYLLQTSKKAPPTPPQHLSAQCDLLHPAELRGLTTARNLVRG